MSVNETIASMKFFTELCDVAMKYDARIMSALIGGLVNNGTHPAKRTLTAVAAKKGPKNLLVAAASVQA